MKGRISRFAAVISAMALVSAPVAVQANTRAHNTPAYAVPSDDDDGTAGVVLQDKTRRLSRDWLVTLFGTAGTIAALAILFSGNSSAGEDPRRPREEPDGPVQSNGAT